MGITIVHKSDLWRRRKTPRIALVLAGGAVTGGAYKLGGLKALDDFLVNRKTTDFDIYVGLSAGAFLAAPLASGVTPPEMLRVLDGNSDAFDFTCLSPLDLYKLNLHEFLSKPIEFLVDLVTYVPNALCDFLVQTPELARSIYEPITRACRRPTLANLIECVKPIIDAIGSAREFPFPLAYLPSGLFDNSRLEHHLRQNIERRRMTNDFRVLYRQRQVALYIVAMNLDTAERVVFGPDEDTSLTVSEAVQASTALPGFYKPARINGVDYVDGGVRRTANIDVAIEHGADLIICYNPFTPFANRVARSSMAQRGRYHTEGRPLADHGILTVLNQVLRTLLHSRLQLCIQQYRDDPNFRGDIILLEPAETDLTFFNMAPLSLWAGRTAGAHGYLSVTQAIQAHYEPIHHILQSYGILMNHKGLRAGLHDVLPVEPSEPCQEVRVRDATRRKLQVARGSARSEQHPVQIAAEAMHYRNRTSARTTDCSYGDRSPPSQCGPEPV